MTTIRLVADSPAEASLKTDREEQVLNRKRRDSWRPTVEGAMAVHEKPAVIDDLDRGERRYLEMPFVRSLLAALAGLLTTTLPVLLVGALGVQLKRDLGFGDASLGLAISLFWISVAACALLAGHYVDRIGWRRGLWTTSIVSAIALAGIAFLSDSWMTLAILLCLAGASNALAMPTTNVLLAVAVPPPHRALAFGIKQAASPASLFLAGLAVPFVALTLGWRWVFVAALVFPLSAVALAGSRSAAPTRKVHRPDAMSVVRGRLSPALLVLTMAGGLGAAVATA